MCGLALKTNTKCGKNLGMKEGINMKNPKFKYVRPTYALETHRIIKK